MAHGQADVSFWFAVPEVSQNGGSNLDRPVFIRMTAFATAATVTLSQPAGGGMPTTVLTIPAFGTVSFDLTPWIDLLETKPANTVLNYGLSIQSTAPISAYYHVVSGACLCNPEDFVLKGANANGVDFWIPGQDTLNNTVSYTPTPTNSFDIIATQNGTTVTITPSHDIIGHLAGITFTVALNQGQVYSATAASNLGPNHLCGSRVVSDKPIAITEKDDLLNFVSGGIAGQDLIGDQIVPVPVLGTEYIPMYGNLGAPPGDKLFITATQTGTNVNVNGVLVASLTAGQTYRMTAPNPTCYIQTNFPVYVYQLSGIISEVGSALLPQINCTGSTSVSFQQSSTINFKINLLVKAAGIGGFLVNGAAGVITPGMFTAVPTTGGVWYAAQVTLPVATYPLGTVLTVTNPANLFQLGYLSSGPVNSGADFGYFSNYGGINPSPTTTTRSVCEGADILLFSNSFTSATYSWTGPGGFTSTLQNPFISPSVYADSGVYKVLVNTPGCVDSGIVNVAVHPFPVVNLGNDTIICGAPPINLQDIAIVYATDSFLWNTGATVNAIPASATGAYWERVSNAGCRTTDTIRVQFIPITAPLVADVTYCQFETPVPLTATGTSLLWYTAATGGVGSATAPTPSTALGGIATWYVSQTIGICESVRVPVSVIVNPLPPPPAIFAVILYCQGQTFVPFTVAGTGVLWYNSPIGGIASASAPFVNTALPGVYTFYASQTVSGCEGPRIAVVVTVLGFIVPAFTSTIHLGCNGDTVFFANSSLGATAYTWDFGDGYGDTAANPYHIYHQQDTFIIKLIARNAQCYDSTHDTVRLVHPLKAAFTYGPNILCQDSLITFTNSSIGSGLSYTWYFGDGGTSNNANPTYIYKKAGIFDVKLIATNLIPCSDTATGTVFSDSLSDIRFLVTDSVLCRSSYVTFSGLYTGIGNTGVTWNFGDGDSIRNINPVAHAFDTTGTFTVWVTAHFRACKDVSFTKNITVYPQPHLFLGPDTAICAGNKSIILADKINDKIPGAQWLWSTGQHSPSIVVTAPGVYSLDVNIHGCHATDAVEVANDCYLDIPNVFSPNGDGSNDYFFPRQYLAKGLSTFKLDIYNRWGQLIFETTNLEGSGWDGKFNNIDQPQGVFVYIIDVTFKDGQKEHHQGNVTLMR
jgi:gliding motility-associated-like protein